MGLLDDLDIEEAELDPNALPDNWYRFRITGVAVQKWKNKKQNDRDEKALVIEYEVNDPDSEFHERDLNDFLSFPFKPKKADWDKEDKERASRLKKRLMQLGIPEDEVNDVSKEDLIGLDVYGKVKNNGDYKNLVEARLYDEIEHGLEEFAG